MKRIVGVLIALSPVAAFGQPPVVVTADERPTMSVGYADLNLATQGGESALRNRLSNAVRTVCVESVGLHAFMIAEQRCRQFAWSAALPQMERAIERAHQLAAMGRSTMVAASISITVR